MATNELPLDQNAAAAEALARYGTHLDRVAADVIATVARDDGAGDSWNYSTAAMSDVELVDAVEAAVLLTCLYGPSDSVSLAAERFRTELLARLAARNPEAMF